jgi:large subunit ribosomal protein L18
MRALKDKEYKRIARHKRIRAKVIGHAARPRVSVHKSLNHFYVQVVDDAAGKVLFGMSTLAKSVRENAKTGGNVKAAELLGEEFAKVAIKKGIKTISFDRGGYMYHGCVKAFADAARKGGMEF